MKKLSYLFLWLFVFWAPLVLADSNYPEAGYDDNSSSAYTQTSMGSPETYSQSGLYLGANAVFYTHTVPDGTALDTLGWGSGTNFLGAGATLGYQFNPYFALQGDYTYFDSVSGTGYYIDSTFIDAPDHYDLQGGDVLLKGMLPLSKRFVLNGFGGVAIVNENTYNTLSIYLPPVVNSNFTNVMPEIGAGASVYLFRHLSLDAAALYAFKTNQINSIITYPLSLTIHF